MNKSLLTANTKVTITDVARKSGVSPAIVSLVLRDKPGISPETYQRMLDIAQILGYIHTPSVQSRIFSDKNCDLNSLVKSLNFLLTRLPFSANM